MPHLCFIFFLKIPIPLPLHTSAPRGLLYISDNPILSPAVKVLLIVHYLSVSAQRSWDGILVQTVSPPSPESDALVKTLKTQKTCHLSELHLNRTTVLENCRQEMLSFCTALPAPVPRWLEQSEKILSKLCHAVFIKALQVKVNTHSLIFLRVKCKEIHGSDSPWMWN